MYKARSDLIFVISKLISLAQVNFSRYLLLVKFYLYNHFS